MIGAAGGFVYYVSDAGRNPIWVMLMIRVVRARARVRVRNSVKELNRVRRIGLEDFAYCL